MTAPQPLPGMPDPADAPRARREAPRFHDLVHITPRCHWCGAQHSFAWGQHNGRRACGGCLGLTFEQVHGTRDKR